MANNKESLNLNGTSQQFLADFAVLREKLLNHLENSDARDKKQDEINNKMDKFIQIVTIHRTYFKIIGAVLGAGLVGFFSWLVA